MKPTPSFLPPSSHTFLNVPASVQQQFDRIGPRWADDVPGHIHYVVQAYTALMHDAPKNGVRVQRDASYGPHERHRLDVFTPENLASPADVLVFVHGGAFVRGDKNVTAELYDNVGYWFARHGIVTVNLEYRLAGDAPYPSGAEDIADALNYLEKHVASWGGNASRIFLMGHSAGGSHVATYCCDPRFAEQFCGGVAGAMLVSARVRADIRADNPNAYAVRAYFGADPDELDRLSPVTHGSQCRVPLLIAIAQHENPHLDTYGAEMLQQVLGSGRMPCRFVQMMRHNHLSIVAHFNSGEEALGHEILSFMTQLCGEPGQKD